MTFIIYEHVHCFCTSIEKYFNFILNDFLMEMDLFIFFLKNLVIDYKGITCERSTHDGPCQKLGPVLFIWQAHTEPVRMLSNLFSDCHPIKCYLWQAQVEPVRMLSNIFSDCHPIKCYLWQAQAEPVRMLSNIFSDCHPIKCYL